jgi:predicted nucleotide-binding protein
MEDDVIGNGKNREFAPRDNVVFEAGYFAGAKRKSRSLVIREKNAKVPSDFGGILYLELPSRKSIAAVETKLTDHIGRMLNGAD